VQLAILYAALAAIATAFNIGSQDVVVRLYHGPFAVTLSIMVGTGVGLLTKYALDKRFIFRFKAQNVIHDARVFTLYASMGVFTTAIFWGFEFSFHYLFQTKELRYLGGLIGLTLGYFTKYQLDKRFVFIKIARQNIRES